MCVAPVKILCHLEAVYGADTGRYSAWLSTMAGQMMDTKHVHYR
jgi:hypothetical protein